MTEIVAASTNNHKTEEMNAIAKEINICRFVPMTSLKNFPKEIVEDGSTFNENAIIKAKALLEYTDKPVIADDSGIVIDALNGEPGIYSARYKGLDSDKEKNELILNLLDGVPESQRTARFVCVLAFYNKNRDLQLFEGTCEGRISTKINGINGFGYDPIFYVPDYKTTMGNLPLDIKNCISHRALALKCFLNYLKSAD